MVTISDSVVDYAQEVRRILRREKLRVDLDDSSSTVNRKVREAQLSKYNYILVRCCCCQHVAWQTYMLVVHGSAAGCSGLQWRQIVSCD